VRFKNKLFLSIRVSVCPPFYALIQTKPVELSACTKYLSSDSSRILL